MILNRPVLKARPKQPSFPCQFLVNVIYMTAFHHPKTHNFKTLTTGMFVAIK
jgi:hypothetical protein